jgi:2,4-dienoyl-CoA reductase-like NADH-dependent reductase (Old Yellow Enzyme family)
MEIFKESKIAGIKLKNRIIRSATHEGFADTSGKPLRQLEDLYMKLATGGAGAVITGFTGVQQNGKGVPNMRLIIL